MKDVLFWQSYHIYNNQQSTQRYEDEAVYYIGSLRIYVSKVV